MSFRTNVRNLKLLISGRSSHMSGQCMEGNVRAIAFWRHQEFMSLWLWCIEWEYGYCEHRSKGFFFFCHFTAKGLKRVSLEGRGAVPAQNSHFKPFPYRSPLASEYLVERETFFPSQTHPLAHWPVKYIKTPVEQMSYDYFGWQHREGSEKSILFWM